MARLVPYLRWSLKREVGPSTLTWYPPLLLHMVYMRPSQLIRLKIRCQFPVVVNWSSVEPKRRVWVKLRLYCLTKASGSTD